MMESQGKKRRVLLIYNRIIPSVRLCGHAQMEKLQELQMVEYKAIRYLDVKAEDLSWADIAILGRPDSWYEYILAKQLHKAGKFVAYILDDDLLNVPPYLSSSAYLKRKDIRRNIERTLAISDALISPSPRILSKYLDSEKNQKGILIEEPAISPVKYMPHDSEAPIHIGFAGSIDRAQDIENILKDALVRIKEEYQDRVAFYFYGAVPKFAEALNATMIPYCESYEEYRLKLNELQWDIGLAPMPQTEFHSCKHYNKFIEYAASAVAGIYSEVEPYTRLKKWDGFGLFSPNNSTDWYENIKYLIENRHAMEQIRRKACEYTSGPLSVEYIARQFYQDLEGYATDTCKKSVRIVLFPYKVWHFVIRAYSFFIANRKNLIPAVWQKIKYFAGIS